MPSLNYSNITVNGRPWATRPGWRVLSVLLVGNAVVSSILVVLTLRPQASSPWALLISLGVTTLNTDALLVVPALAAVLVTLAVLAASRDTKASLQGVLQLHAPLLCGVLAIVELELALLGLLSASARWDHLFAVVALSLIVLLGSVVVARSFLARRKSERRFAKQMRKDAERSAMQLGDGRRYATGSRSLLASMAVALVVALSISAGLGVGISVSTLGIWPTAVFFVILAAVMALIVTLLGTLPGAGDPSLFGRVSSFIGAGLMAALLLASVVAALLPAVPNAVQFVLACLATTCASSALAGFGPANRGLRWFVLGSAVRSAMLRNRYVRHAWAKGFLAP